MAMYDEVECAKAGYHVYAHATYGENMPAWHHISEDQKKAWIAATAAITSHFNHFLIMASLSKEG